MAANGRRSYAENYAARRRLPQPLPASQGPHVGTRAERFHTLERSPRKRQAVEGPGRHESRAWGQQARDFRVDDLERTGDAPSHRPPSRASAEGAGRDQRRWRLTPVELDEYTTEAPARGEAEDTTVTDSNTGSAPPGSAVGSQQELLSGRAPSTQVYGEVSSSQGSASASPRAGARREISRQAGSPGETYLRHWRNLKMCQELRASQLQVSKDSIARFHKDWCFCMVCLRLHFGHLTLPPGTAGSIVICMCSATASVDL